MKLFTKAFQVLLLVVTLQQTLLSQSCPTVNAQAGTGASTTICSGQCASLTATVVPINATTTYSVGSITYSPYAYTGGTAVIGNVDDVWSSPVNIGFNFCYFGSTFNQLLLGSNGEITFDLLSAVSSESFLVTQTLPNTVDHPVNTICGAYRDIDPSDVSLSPQPSVNYYVSGAAPCRVFVANWADVPLYGCQTPTSTFQIVLHESTNIIEVFIQNSSACSSWQNGRGIIGIQDGTGTTAVAPASRNTLAAWTATDEGWQFMPTGAPNYTVSWAGSDGFTATGLTATPCPTATTNYTATMNVADCGGGTSSYTSAVQVSVTPTPTLMASASPTAICRSSSTTLTASGATSYTWSPGGATTASISVTPTVNTTYTVRGSNGSCVTTQTVFVKVNLSTTITVTSNPTIVCSSGSVTLTGTGSSTYTWNPGGLTGNTVVVTPTTTTQYTVVATNSLGCNTIRTLNVTVSSSPTITATASSTTACAGSTVSLSAGGGTSYTWTPGSLVGATVVVTPTANTTYTVRGRNAAGCTSTNTIAIMTTPGITVTASASPTIICRGASSTLTASGATSYTWNPGALTGSTAVVSPTTTTVYSVTGSDLGCTNTRTVSVNVSVPTITATKIPTTAVCAGNSATLSATGAVTFTWNPGASVGFSVAITPSATTIYTVTGTNTLGCVGTRTISAVVAPNPTITASASPTSICAGTPATLTAGGAITFTWTPGSLTGSTVVVTPTTSTTYTVRGRSSQGCISNNTLSLNVTPAVTVTPVASPSVICSGNSSTLSATGATSYTWNPGALTGSSVTVNPTVTTTYSVTGVNGLGCTNTRTISVATSTISINASSNPTILCSSSTATLTATGASTYTWNPGTLTGASVTVTPASTTIYTVTGTNSVGCTATQTLSLGVGATPTIGVSASSTVCEGTTSTLTATGGTSYTWNPGALTGSSVSVSPSTTTIYTVTGANASGCSSSNTVEITVNPTPIITASSDPVILCGGQTATLSASGANTYTWNPGAMTGSTLTVSPMVTTVYTVTATSSLGCIGSGTVNLKVSPNPTLTTLASPSVICSGNSSTLTANGAASYTWNPGALTGSSITVNPTVTTTYSVSGNNGLGCIVTETLTLTVNTTPTVTANASPIAMCAGHQATLTANGATNYTWSPGALSGNTVVVTPTTTTTYTVDGDNGTACISSQTVTVVIAVPSISITASPTVLCAPGSVTLTASGGSTYTWSPGGGTTTSIVDSPTITTTYTVSSDNGAGCIGTQTITVVVSTPPTLTLSASSNTICAGSSTTLTANGASTYTWNPGAITGSTVSVIPGTTTIYTVTADNGVGCIASETITINVNPTPSLTITPSSTVLCSAGSVTLTASGSTTYTWNPGGATTASIVDSPTITTTYTVSSDNATGCIGTQTVTVNVSSMPSLTVSAASNTICAGSTTTLSASGASTYTWNPGALTGATVVITPTASTTYTVDGDNGLGCVSSQTIDITTTPGLTLTPASTSNTLCAGSPATLTIGGASTYTWNPGALTGATVVVTPTTSTTYTINADNGAGCTGTATLAISVNAIPSISISATSTVFCSAGSVTMTASGATTYTWMPLAAVTPTVFDSPSVTTTYTVTGDDGSGCIGTETITINVSTMPTVTASTSSNTICAGSTVTLTTGGASTYTWNPGALSGTMVTVSPTVTTTYTVDGDNGSGCVDSETITVNVNALPSLSITASSTVLCSAGSITLTASGGTTYTWSPGGATTASIVDSPTITTTYTVSSDNAAGCIGTETITVNVGTAPSVTITATPVGTICAGTTATLTASGAASYTWNPTAATTTVITDNPSTTTTYTVTGDNGFGCTATNTFVLNVAAGSSITAVANPTAACANSTINLSASGATTYTWLPMGTNGASVTATPSVSTTYTALGDNGSCIATATVFVNITSPQNVTASVSGDITCLTPSVNLFGNTTSSPVVYLWTGPNSYTSTAQNPTGITDGGAYTLGVVDLISGCVTTTMVTVITNTTISGLVATTSGSLGCLSVVTLSAASTTTNTLTYAWSGPSSFTSAVQNPTTNIAGDYTVSVNDALTGCNGTSTITVGTTTVTPTLTATVSGSLSCIGDVTLTATSSSTNTTYEWSGPSSFTSAVQNPTINIGGDYTVSVTDVSTGCSTTTMVSVGSNTIGPNLTATASGSLDCIGTVTLNATSTSTNTLTYAWSGPSSFTAAVQNPTVSVAGDYTISLTDGTTGCSTTTIVSVGSNTVGPNLTASASSSLGCVGTVTLNAATTSTNTLSYVWLGPASFTAAVQSPTTSIAGAYTVAATDAVTGCSSTATVTIGTNTVVPTLTATVSNSLGCAGSVTLTATSTSTNTLAYAWSGPSSFTSAVQSPTTNIAGDYTVTLNDMASGCSSTATVTVSSNTVAPDLTASASGSVGCTGSVTLTASSTNTNTTYVWSGPSSFTTAVQNPTINIAGDYTVAVTDAASGCSSSTVVSVGSDSVIPVVGIAVPGPVLGCNTTVTLSVITAPTSTLTFDWSGPSSFTSTAQTPTTSVAGDYTVTVTDLANGCQNTVAITVGFSTVIPVYSVTITPATCTGTLSNNDGTIMISGNSSTDTYDISQAATYTGTATYATANAIGFGILTNTLVNPSSATPYTIRVFSNNGCFKDTTVILTPVSCTVAPVTTLGMTKAASTPTFVNNSAYNVTYTVVATNVSSGNMTNFSIIDNLNNTFPSPATFSVITPPVVTSLNSSLTINAGYDGSLQTDLLSPLTSTLGAGKKDTIVFTVQINPNGFFGPFNNSAVGSGIDSNSIAVADSSNTGFAWDPDNDGDPTNNDIPTTVTLNAKPSIGVAKSGSATVLEDKTIDVTYVITVKNLGNDTLRNVQVLDTLRIPSPAQFNIKSGPSTSSGLAANSNYNGISDIRLLDANLSKLAPGQTETITFVVNITPESVKSITNTAIGLGLGSQGPIVRDTSNNGSDPDPNGNLDATENGENIPTIVELPDRDLFIPEVFTPDGDGRNDFFVIKGIEGRTVKLTVFNRWGNKVYSSDAYDNTWSGTPNTGGLTIGSGKLPQGTYYYIVEFEDGEDDPVNGYVVLQY